MRSLTTLLTAAVALGLCLFAYTSLFRPIDPPTQTLRELEAHLIYSELPGALYPVKHGYSHARVKAAAAFQIVGYPLPLGLLDCGSEEDAAAFAAKQDGLPPELQPARNGTLVLDFSGWGDDTFLQAASARKAFLSFRRKP